MTKPIQITHARKSVTPDDIDEISRVLNNDFYRSTATAEASRIIRELWAENAELKQRKAAAPAPNSLFGNSWFAPKVELGRKA